MDQHDEKPHSVPRVKRTVPAGVLKQLQSMANQQQTRKSKPSQDFDQHRPRKQDRPKPSMPTLPWNEPTE